MVEVTPSTRGPRSRCTPCGRRAASRGHCPIPGVDPGGRVFRFQYQNTMRAKQAHPRPAALKQRAETVDIEPRFASPGEHKRRPTKALARWRPTAQDHREAPSVPHPDLRGPLKPREAAVCLERPVEGPLRVHLAHQISELMLRRADMRRRDQLKPEPRVKPVASQRQGLGGERPAQRSHRGQRRLL